jgi:hypothetical protein
MSTPFIYGEEASQAKFVGSLEEIRQLGNDVIDLLEADRQETLIEFDRRLSAMNGRRQRSNRVITPGRMAQFVTSDFLDIDQSKTTATVRADASAVSLRERAVPSDALIRSLSFTVTIGTVEKLDLNDTLFRVHTTGGSIPTGVFDIELIEPLNLTLMIFDTAATPSEPMITVETSANGVSYDSAVKVTRNGYRINAWITPAKVRFVRLTIQPSHPDLLSGDTFTFGITSFSANGLEFHLRSEYVSRTLTFKPRKGTVKFVADTIPGVTYFVSMGVPGTNPPFLEVKPDDVLTIPGSGKVGIVSPLSVGLKGTPWTPDGGGTTLGTTVLGLGTFVRPTVPNGFVYEVTTGGTTGASEPVWPVIAGNTIVSGTVTFTTRVDGIINHTFPTTAYIHSLKVTGDDDGKTVPVACGLSYLDPNVAKMINRYIAILSTEMRLVRGQIALDVGKTFTLQYETGPAKVECRLKVQLSTEDRALSPTFQGASLQEL